MALLSETGYRVEHRESCEGTAEHFDLVRCDETLFSGLTRVVPPVLLIGAALPDPKVLGAVKRPIKPQELLDRVGAALLSPATLY